MLNVRKYLKYQLPNGIPNSNAILRKNDCFTVSAVGTINAPSSSLAADICSFDD